LEALLSKGFADRELSVEFDLLLIHLKKKRDEEKSAAVERKAKRRAHTLMGISRNLLVWMSMMSARMRNIISGMISS